MFHNILSSINIVVYYGELCCDGASMNYHKSEICLSDKEGKDTIEDPWVELVYSHLFRHYSFFGSYFQSSYHNLFYGSML
jgi:hypothetical protein